VKELAEYGGILVEQLSFKPGMKDGGVVDDDGC